jgi:adenosylcobyric acid synthase
VGDIDRGGIFASLLGSYMLLTPTERERIAGFIVNKLRGDPALFSNGIEILESHAGRPVFGVIPHFDHIALPEEDSVALGRRMQQAAVSPCGDTLALGIVRLPFISNYTDFDCFEHEPGVNVVYFDRPDRVFHFDAVILPGSKNTIEDLAFLQRTGLADAIVSFYKWGGTVVGLCGGYQMLGLRVRDPHGVESGLSEIAGLGLLEMETEMEPEKVTCQVEARLRNEPGFSGDCLLPLHGYEIHMGRSLSQGACRPLFRIVSRDGRPVDVLDGLVQPDGRVWGTYIHGIFDNDHLRRSFLHSLQSRSGKAHVSLSSTFAYRQWKDEQYDLLAEHVRRHTDVQGIYRSMGL